MDLKKMGRMVSLHPELEEGLSPHFMKLLKPYMKERKECLFCGEGHIHNNSFCSALCCEKYRLVIFS